VVTEEQNVIFNQKKYLSNNNPNPFPNPMANIVLKHYRHTKEGGKSITYINTTGIQRKVVKVLHI